MNRIPGIVTLPVGGARCQIILATDVRGLFRAHSLQLGAVRDAVSQPSTVRTPHLPSNLQQVLRLRLERDEEGRHLLLGLHQQVLEVQQH